MRRGPMESRPTIMTVQELARYLRVHVMTIYRMIRSDGLPAMRVGHSWRFKKDQVDHWLSLRAINSHHEAAGTPRPGRRARRKPHGA